MPRVRRKRVPPEISAVVIQQWGNRCWLDMPGCTGEADTSDHIIPAKWGGPTIPSNLRRACRHCNSLRHERGLSGYGATYHAVIGPPFGGKSTYVRGHAKRGDLVIDFDALATTLTYDWEGQHLQPQRSRELATGAWYGAYQRSLSIPDPLDVWIVKTLPETPRSPQLLLEWIALDYDIVVCDPGRPEVMRRAGLEDRGRAASHGIHDWYRHDYGDDRIRTMQTERRRRLTALGLRHDAPDDEKQPTTGGRPEW